MSTGGAAAYLTARRCARACLVASCSTNCSCVVGLIVMLACLAILAMLFIDLIRDGSPRFGWDFFTNFASRRAERAGILAAWVGTSLFMRTNTPLVMILSRSSQGCG